MLEDVLELVIVEVSVSSAVGVSVEDWVAVGVDVKDPVKVVVGDVV